MLEISKLQNDPMQRFQNSVYLGDIEERIQLLLDVGQLPLAYMTAKSHGLTEQAESVLATAGKTEDEIELPSMDDALPSIPQPVVQLEDPNWPLLTVSKSFFEGAFIRQQQQQPQVAGDISSVMNKPNFTYADDAIDEAGGDWGDDDDDLGLAATVKPTGDDLLNTNDDEFGDAEEGGGWDDDDLKAELDAELGHVAAKETAEFVAPTEGVSESMIWTQNSNIAADHIAAGYCSI
ncbi:hypothetical protein G6F68_013045 [Rhizopus microsporus]|nr:hypothetical protein G6F68_013045 [Rhizopus microsporus]